ncbi:MAG: HDIG domain-containing protein [Candidatus Methanomethylophilaceae archaeon]|nr:HDIG domain-containing protein [Candidatus Methanomethylophilaceae archaeon]MDD3378871.1 HDIG domain-containing protein [Candidatus Methanomethylophilaceae archaeon]MDY0223976.1 HDIG domain-containing protein [Candidatus Methanomethylophilaceae archaeon]
MSARIPNDLECIDILYDAGCKKRVVIHCCTVRAVAEEMLNGIRNANKDLVIAGALLHDIGRSTDHSIMHAMVGAEIAEKLDLSPMLVEIIRKHTGAGLDAQDVRELGLPPGDYMPKTLEEKMVAHADNLVSDNKVVTHDHSVDKLRFRGADRGADRIEALHWELSKLYGMDLDIISDIIGEYPKLKGVTL